MSSWSSLLKAVLLANDLSLGLQFFEEMRILFLHQLHPWPLTPKKVIVLLLIDGGKDRILCVHERPTFYVAGKTDKAVSDMVKPEIRRKK